MSDVAYCKGMSVSSLTVNWLLVDSPQVDRRMMSSLRSFERMSRTVSLNILGWDGETVEGFWRESKQETLKILSLGSS